MSNSIIGWVRDSKPDIFWYGANKPSHFDDDEGQAVRGKEIKDINDEDALIGDLMPIGEWLECVECGGFIDYDGFGDQVIYNPDRDKYYTVEHETNDMGVVYPSQAASIPSYVTHIIWYNR